MRAANLARFFGSRAENLGAGEVRKVFSFCVPIYRWVIGLWLVPEAYNCWIMVPRYFPRVNPAS